MGGVYVAGIGRRDAYIFSTYDICMARRTTIEIDEELLARAKRALGQKTARATVEEALRRAADSEEGDRVDRATRQRRFLDRLGARADLDVLASGAMWR